MGVQVIKVKELRKKNTHRHRQQYSDYQREREVGAGTMSKGVINGDW